MFGVIFTPQNLQCTQYIHITHVLSSIFEIPGEFDSAVYTCLQ